MPLLPISAVEAVSPAIEWTRRLLFRPFRFGMWIRLAVLGLLTGEMSNGGGFNFNVPAPQTHGNTADHFLPAPPHLPPHILPIIVFVALAFIIFVLVFLYLGSVFRFVLLEGIVTGRVRLREGFARWQQHGTRFFVWQLVFGLLLWGVIVVSIGTPLLLAWRAGIFKQPRAHLEMLILGGILLVLVLVIVFVVGMTIFVLTKDFVVPIMALEGVGPVEGWRRLLPALTAAKGSYAGYLGMKLVLALAAAVLLAIIDLVAILLLAIPVVITGILAYFVAQAAGLGWNVFTITAAIVAGAVLLALLLFLIVMLAVPMVVFFQCYVLQFFAGRYERLAQWMYPPPPPAPAPAPA